jgi:cell division protein FtsW
MPRVLDAAPRRPVGFAEAGLSRGWEPAALMMLTLLLLAFGLVTLYSASAFKALQEDNPDTFYVLRQAGGAALGLVAMVAVSRFPFRLWKRVAWPLMWATWFLLILIILPGTEAIAPEINGARRWLRIGFTFQPSELAKLAIIVWSAALCVKKEAYFSSLRRGLLPFLVVWAALILPILLEPDLSTAALVGMLGAVVVFAGGARFGHFVFLGLLMLPVVMKQLLVGFRLE